MAPLPVTDDYYMILEVSQAAPLALIIRSYKRLALKLHPDRNKKHDATAAFQLLGKAYETLKDETRRREYDVIYPTIAQNRDSDQPTQTANQAASQAAEDTAQIAALQRSKRERGERWIIQNTAYQSSIAELQRDIRSLEQAVRNLDTIAAAEMATEAWKNSWGAWLVSPLYKVKQDNEEERERKDRGRQERQIEKDMKERRLEIQREKLRKEEALLKTTKQEIDAADHIDDNKIRNIQYRIKDRETRERQEREKAEMERTRKAWKRQQEMAEQRAAEELRRQEAERDAFWKAWREKQEMDEKRAAEELRERQAEEEAERKRYEEEVNRWQNILNGGPNSSFTSARRPEDDLFCFGSAYDSTCRHEGWWPKVQGRTTCPDCLESWSYLLQCPNCSIKACPRCQYDLRPKGPRDTARTRARARRTARSSPYDYPYDWSD